MTGPDLPGAYFIAHMGAADFLGLVISVLICAYLLYALLRGERF
jgi:K+-transporting ATPase KdpF subunit